MGICILIVFLVSGQYKGQGYANKLLEYCIAEKKGLGKVGLVVLSSQKKKLFLSDSKYLKYKGFQVSDQTETDFELLYLPFSHQAPIPKFKTCAKEIQSNQEGLVLYYTHQCPFASKYAPHLQEIANKKGDVINACPFKNKGRGTEHVSSNNDLCAFL